MNRKNPTFEEKLAEHEAELKAFDERLKRLEII